VHPVSLLGASAYLIVEERLTLIDAGLRGSWLLLRRAIRRLGRDAGEIARILLTHEHPDHAGGARAVAKATGAEMGGAAQLADGELLGVLGGLTVLRTPGHTPGSLCFYAARDRLLFSGDALWCDGRRLHPPNRFWSNDLGAARLSVEPLATLDIATIAFGHLAPLHGDCTAGMRDLLARWTSPTG
jgi:glyoxylase-like metal-dependent hydrolase (beta-lactamase superfamily II)